MDAKPPHPASRDAFDRRHHRVGHLFQNRYKSPVVEAAPCLWELVRDLHLNPLRTREGNGDLWTDVRGHLEAMHTVLNTAGSRVTLGAAQAKR